MKLPFATLKTARPDRPHFSGGTNANGKGAFCLTLLALAYLILPAHSAVTLGLWDFDNSAELNFLNTTPAAGPYSGSTYSNAAGAVPYLTVSSLSVGSGLRTNGGAGTLSSTGTAVSPSYNGVMGVGGSNPYVFPSAAAATASPAAAITASDFFSVTLTPESGYALNLTEISFYAWANQTNTSGSYTYFVQSSATGSTILGTTTKAYDTTGAVVNNNTAPSSSNLYSFDLSAYSADLTNVSTPITFTVGVYSTTNGSLRLDSLQIQGEVVPEPSRALLLGVALGCCLLRRRRGPLRSARLS
ncbi:PEP-CTERM sorting domain-containing protein [Verrucomicrobium spinosum]|uniref:PEP-CTERM sorting domain-containing protein n=1 Tax=Verrucomicrobium spinosum TaxID=2736 RepID=UPI000174440B|nr:PEP-CTERM sorting domain-containing protein [Verrucomicrobium spinosum]